MPEWLVSVLRYVYSISYAAFWAGLAVLVWALVWVAVGVWVERPWQR